MLCLIMGLLTAVFYLIKESGREGLIQRPPRNMHLTCESDFTGTAVSVGVVWIPPGVLYDRIFM